MTAVLTDAQRAKWSAMSKSKASDKSQSRENRPTLFD